MKRISPLPTFLLCILTLAVTALCAFGQQPTNPGLPPLPTESTAAPAPAQQPAAEAPVTPMPSEAPPAIALPTLTPQVAPTQPAEIRPAAPVPIPIVSIEIQGAEPSLTQQILSAISSKVGGFYTEEQLSRDRESALRLGWFQTVSAEREMVPNGVKLIFRVKENPVIREIQFTGIHMLTREQLLAVMETKPGSIYNVRYLEQDAQRIEELYRKHGHILAVVFEILNITEQGVLTLNIAEGVIESIRITGNTYTKTYVVQRYIHAKPGDVYNQDRVSEDVARLNNTGFFTTVRTDAEVGEQPGKIIVIYIVVEKERTGMASIGAAYTSVQGAIGYLDLSKTNLRGTGQAVSLRGEFGGRRSYELGYRNPWIMSPETSLSLGIYDRFILREAFVTQPGGARTNIFYRERRAGGNLVLGRPVSSHTTVYAGLRRDDVSLSDISPEQRAFLSGTIFSPSEVRSLSLTSVTNTRDSNENPRTGAFRQFSTEFSGIFGGVKFNKYSADNRRYFPLGKNNVFAVRLLLGTVTGTAPYLEQFLIGGPDSLRGYRIDRFAGSHMAILNTEIRHPLTTALTGVGFVDIGDAWGGPIGSDPLFESDPKLKLHIGYGVGVRVQTPVGPLRLDLGFSREGAETHFGIANAF